MARKEGYRWFPSRWQPNDRQRAVLDLLAEGKSNAEIAVRLGITPDGAKWHVGELLAQTGVEDRQALASWWRREKRQGWVLLPGLRVGWLARGSVAVAVVLTLVTLTAVLIGDRTGAPAAVATPPATEPTPWPERDLEALAASQGPPPATCEPPETQDLALVSPAELLAEGLEPAGRILIAGHCPLYVANRADRSLLWVAGGALVHIEPPLGQVMSATGCCLSANLSVNGLDYHLYGSSGWQPGESVMPLPAFTPLDRSLTRIEPSAADGAYVLARVREIVPITDPRILNTQGPRHRVAFASDGQMFVDARPLPADLVLNDLTGEEIDLTRMQEIGRVHPGRTSSVRTDCYAGDACNVYLDSVGGARHGDTGVFNPPIMLAPFDGVLTCVAIDTEDGPVLAYELSTGSFRLRAGAFGGYTEAWNEGCAPRDVRRGHELAVWSYTSLRAFTGDEAISIVSTRDGVLFIGEVALDLDCPCEIRR